MNQHLSTIAGLRRLQSLLEQRSSTLTFVERSDEFGDLIRIGSALAAVQDFDGRLSVVMFDGGVAVEKIVEMSACGIDQAVEHILTVASRNP